MKKVMLFLFLVSTAATADFAFPTGTRGNVAVVFTSTTLGAGNLTSHPRGARLVPFTTFPAVSTALYAVQVYSTSAQERAVINENGLAALVISSTTLLRPVLLSAPSSTAFQLARLLASRFPDVRGVRNAFGEGLLPPVTAPVDQGFDIRLHDASGDSAWIRIQADGRLSLEAIAVPDASPIARAYVPIQGGIDAAREELASRRIEIKELSDRYALNSYYHVQFASAAAYYRSILPFMPSKDKYTEVYNLVVQYEAYDAYHSGVMKILADYGIEVNKRIAILDNATSVSAIFRGKRDFKRVMLTAYPLETYAQYLAETGAAEIEVVSDILADFPGEVALVLDRDYRKIRIAGFPQFGSISTRPPRPNSDLLTQIFGMPIPESWIRTNFPDDY